MNFFSDILSSLFDRKLGLANRVEDDNKPIDDLCQALLSSSTRLARPSLRSNRLDSISAKKFTNFILQFSMAQGRSSVNERSSFGLSQSLAFQ